MRMQGFKSNLEYLEAYFGILLKKTRLSSQETNSNGDMLDDDDDWEMQEFLRKSEPSVRKDQPNREDIQTELLVFRQRVDDTQIILPFEEIAKKNQLSSFEKNVVALALAVTADNRFTQSRKSSLRKPLKIRDCINVLSDNFEDRVSNRRCFSIEGRLIQNGLISQDTYRRGQGNESDFLDTEIKLPRRISSAIYGENAPDDMILSYCEIVKPAVDIQTVVMDAGKKKEVIDLIHKRGRFVDIRKEWGLEEILPYGTGSILLFSGSPGTGKTYFTHALARHCGMKLLQVNVPRLLGTYDHFDDNFRLVLRESKLQSAMLFFDEADELFQDRSINSHMATILREMEKFDGICILATNRRQMLDEALDRRIIYKLDFELPKSDMREKIWNEHLPKRMPLDKNVNIKELAERYEFSGGYIKNAVLLAIQRAISRCNGGNLMVSQEDLIWGAQRQRNSQLERFADKVVPSVCLESVILPDKHREVIGRIIAEYRNSSKVFDRWGFKNTITSGRAITALFHGAAGTGKSMCAEAIAKELNLNLYPVKIPEVISCYVGKTAKNLSEVFAEAKYAEAVLLFDEADALFSSRLNEGSHHATFINQDVDTLLMEIEKFSGIVILTTNLYDRIDKAFMRRIRHHLEFPMPCPKARAEIWRRHFPKDAPIAENLDFERLGRQYEFSGGIIRNVILKSAFEASCDGQVITQEIIEKIASEEIEMGCKRKRQIGFAAA